MIPERIGATFYRQRVLALELYDLAEEMYGKALKIKADMSSGHIGLICTYLSQGKQELAIEQNKRFRANPDKDRYFVKAADVEFLLGNIKDARAFAEQGANGAPEARYYPRGVYATTILGCVQWEAESSSSTHKFRTLRAQPSREFADARCAERISAGGKREILRRDQEMRTRQRDQIHARRRAI